MSDDTVASLGFAVNSQPLDDAKQKLGGLTDQAKKTEDQANKTSDALNKMGSGAASGGIKNAAAAADQLAASFAKAGAEGQKQVGVSQQLDQIVAKTGVSYTQAVAALNAAITAHRNSADAASSHGAALGGLGRDASSAAPAIDAVAKSVSNTSNALSGVGQFLKSSSVELTGFVSAAVAASTAITKAGDEVLRAKNNFNALTGSAVE
ncbi:hypothetical protein, partial [Bradyrhizobium elkanii]|uniref:hypothetical protein n=1 Tax=Bradyrhizobium elkanii TaxID=29448 RepID=UPI00056FFBDE